MGPPVLVHGASTRTAWISLGLATVLAIGTARWSSSFEETPGWSSSIVEGGQEGASGSTNLARPGPETVEPSRWKSVARETTERRVRRPLMLPRFPSSRLGSAPRPSAPFPSVASTEFTRVVVADETGRPVVARVHGEADGRVAVLLPDGRLGWPDRLVFTSARFRPATADELIEVLRRGPYRTFAVLQTKHYVVFHQSSAEFAAASAQLLESLHAGLSASLAEDGLAVHESEFPLVAVIFRTERDFRAHRPVDPDVQAYYDILSNRIFFYETSGHDEAAPEIAARRKPQTVAHEGTHQLLQNIGVHPRLAAWPTWLVEGLAEYYAPTTTRRGGWDRPGKVNPFHMATLRDLDGPIAVQLRRGGPSRPRVGRATGISTVEYLATRAELSPTDYALAWALTHYLVSRHRETFFSYVTALGRVRPLEKRTPGAHLESFRSAFGTDLVGLDRKISIYLANLKKYEIIPYYCVMFEQAMLDGSVRRDAVVSQSPSSIRQWLDGMHLPQGGPSQWKAISCASRSEARRRADAWSHPR